jgi:hypothetical protein
VSRPDLGACRGASSEPDRLGSAGLGGGRRRSARAVRTGATRLRAVRRGLPAWAPGRASTTARERPRPHAHACGRGLRRAAAGPVVARTACRYRACGSRRPGPCLPRAAAAGTAPCPLPTPPCVVRRYPALGSARISPPPESLRSRHQSLTPHASAAARCHAAVTHAKSRGDERMTMARKALRKIRGSCTKVKLAIDRTSSGPGSGRQAAANDLRSVSGRPAARAMTPRPGRPEQRRPGHRRGGWPGRRTTTKATTRGQCRPRDLRCSARIRPWIPMLGAHWRDRPPH